MNDVIVVSVSVPKRHWAALGYRPGARASLIVEGALSRWARDGFPEWTAADAIPAEPVGAKVVVTAKGRAAAALRSQPVPPRAVIRRAIADWADSQERTASR